jgi:hypothetical protein
MFGSSEEVTDGKKVKEKGIHLFVFVGRDATT